MNFRVVVGYVNQGEDLSYRIEDVETGGMRQRGTPPSHIEYFVSHVPALPSGMSVTDLKTQLRAMLAACDQPVLFLREHPSTLEQWPAKTSHRRRTRRP